MTIHNHRRRVFGRLKVTSGGKAYHVTLTRDGLQVRRWYGRSSVTFDFDQIISLLGEMPLEPVEVKP